MVDAMINGQWMNIHTGDIITVANSFMDESDQMILRTNKGNLSFDEFSRNYIQTSDEVIQEMSVPEQLSQEQSDNNLILPDDDLLIDDVTVNINDINNVDIITKEEKEEKDNSTNSIIEDIFNKIDTTPNIEIALNWDKFPINDIKTLTKYLNLTLEDIADYIVTKYVNKEIITLSVKDYLNNLL